MSPDDEAKIRAAAVGCADRDHPMFVINARGQFDRCACGELAEVWEAS